MIWLWDGGTYQCAWGVRLAKASSTTTTNAGASNSCPAYNLRVIHLRSAAKAGLFVTLTIALSEYGLDCGGAPTTEQSMRCCNTMRCHSPHNHRNRHPGDCCNTMPQMYAVLGQPPAQLSISFSPATLGMVQSFRDPISEFAAKNKVGSHSHDPPKLAVFATARNLRVWMDFQSRLSGLRC